MALLDNADRTTVALAAASGARSLIGPTIVANALRGRPNGSRQPARALAHPQAAVLLGLMAAGETIGDKLPGIPARVSPPALGGRVASGALVGAAIAAVSGGSRIRGAVIGGATAALSTVVTYRVRQWLGTRTGLPDRLLAVIEDALVLRLASGASAGVRRAAFDGRR
jgi:uncharacterized membrane protein